MIRVVVAVLLTAILLPAADTASAQGTNDETKTERVSGAIRRVVVDNENGDVTILPGPTASVTRTERWNFVRPSYRHSVANGTLTVRASCPEVLLNDCSVDLLVHVPRTVAVRAETVNGAMRVSKFSGTSVSAAVTNGSVRLSDLLSPDVRGGAGNGDIRATFDARPNRVRLTSTNGDVVASVPKGVYDIRADTTNGDVAVRGLTDDPDSVRRLSAVTTNGDVVLSGD